MDDDEDLLTFEELTGGAPSDGGGATLTFEELTAGGPERNVDPRDLAAARTPQQPPYLGAIGQQNAAAARPLIPGTAGISGSALSDGMAEVTGFMAALADEEQARRPYKPRGAGIMWDYAVQSGQTPSLAPTRVSEQALGLKDLPPEMTPGAAAEYLSGVPGRMWQRFRGITSTAAGAATGRKELLEAGERELQSVSERERKTRPVAESDVANWALSAAESIAQLGVGALLGALVGQPVAGGLIGFGVTSGGESYARLRKEGVPRGRAGVAATTVGGLEALTELIPTAKAIKMLGGVKAFKDVLAPAFAKNLAQFAAGELGGEVLNNLGQEFAENVAKHPDAPLEESVRVAVAETMKDLPDIVGVTGMQSLMLSALGLPGVARRVARGKPQDSSEAAGAITEMQRQAREQARRALQGKIESGAPVEATEPWETAQRAFQQERAEDGSVVYVAPSGARITPEQWASAGSRMRAVWLKPRPVEPEKSAPPPPPTPEQILKMKPTEELTATPAPLTSERLEKLLQQRRAAVSKDVREKIDREIQAERAALERGYAAEEFARMAEEEADPARKALLWNAAAKLVAPPKEKVERPSTKGIEVREVGLDELGGKPEPKPPIKGIEVREIVPEEAKIEGPAAEALAPQEEERAQAEAERYADEQRAAEIEAQAPALESSDSLVGMIAATRRRIASLSGELARMGDSPATAGVKSMLAKERRKLRELVGASEMLAEAGKTTDETLAEKLRADAQKIVAKHAAAAEKQTSKEKESKPKGKAAKGGKEITKLSESPLIKAIMSWSQSMGTPGIDRSLMGDIGVEEPTTVEEKYVHRKGKVFKVKVPKKMEYRIGIGEKGLIFRKGGIQEDGIMHAMSEHGYLPPYSMIRRDGELNWVDEAFSILRAELEDPGSQEPIYAYGDPVGALMEKRAREREDRWMRQRLDEAMAIAETIGIETEGKSPREIEDAVDQALAADWTKSIPPDLEERAQAEAWRQRHGLTEADATRAAIIRRAMEIDEAAVERAALRFENDDAAFLRSVLEIVHGAETERAAVPETPQGEQALLSRARNAGARVPSVAGVAARTPDLEARQPQGGAADQTAARREPGAGAGQPGENAGAQGPRPAAGQQRAAEERRAAPVAPAAGPTEIPKQGQAYLDEMSERLSERFGEPIRLIEVDTEDAEAMMPRKAAQLRAIAEVFGRFGATVRYYRSVGEHFVNGFYDQGRKDFWVSIEADRPFAAVAGHEFGHWLEYHHPDLWNDFVRAIEADLDLPPYKRELLAKYENDRYERMKDDANVKRELVSDIIGDLFADTEFHAALMRAKPSLYARIARAIKTFIDELLARVLGKGPLPNETHKYLRDLQKARRHAVRMLSALGERVDAQAEMMDAVQAAMESIGLPGTVNRGLLQLSMATRPVPSALVTLPEENDFEAKWFDSFARVAQLEDEYRKQVGIDLPDEQSVRLAEKLFHGRVQYRADKFSKEYLEPLGVALKNLRKLKLTIRDADDYLMALHAPERNQTLKDRDPNGRDGLSGLTNADAAQILASFGAKERAALQEVAKHVRAIQDFRLDVLVEAGLVKKEAADYLRQRWPNYVPLKTLEVEARELGTGVGFEMWDNDLRVAFGRTTRASTPIGFTLSDTVRAIVRAEKARVEQRVWRLAHNPALREIIRPYDPQNVPPQIKKKRMDPKTGDVSEVLDPAAYERHVMSLVIDGEQQKVFVADETLLRQLRRAGEFENVGAVLEAVGTLTRTLGRTLTEWNPNWFLPNAIKDAVSASIRSLGIEGMNTARMLAEIPRSWLDISAHKLGMRTEGARMYEEFLQAGAQTGAYGIEGPEVFLRKLQKRGADVGYLYGERSIGARLADPVRSVLHAISVANEVVEYATRFAAFKEARRAGYSTDRSAEIAKEITVNFNRRGEMSRAFGSLFVFFNAAMQGVYGTAKFFGVGRDVVRPGSVEHRKVVAGAAALAVLGAIMQAVNELAGGDDEETGEKVVNEYPDFTLDHNVSLTTTAGIAKIPLPPEYSFFYAFGRRLYRAASQRDVVREAAGIAGNLLDSAFPLRVSDETPVPIGAFKAITPSVLVPIAEVATNTNFLGASIVPEQIGGGPPVPLYTLSRPTTSMLAKDVARVLNEATGGDRARPGMVQKVLGPFASPEAIEHVTRAYTGGLGQTVLQAGNVASRLVGKNKDVELAPSKMPVVARFYSEKQSSYVDRMYRKVADEVQYEKRAARLGQEPKNPAAAAVAPEYEAAERQLRPLYKRFRDAAEAQDETEKRLLRQDIDRIKAGLLRSYNEARRRGQ